MGCGSDQAINAVRRRFGSEIEVESLTGISRRTLQKDRFLGRMRFPWYRSGRRILYDLDEIVSIIKAAAERPSSAEFRANGNPHKDVPPQALRPSVVVSVAAERPWLK